MVKRSSIKAHMLVSILILMIFIIFSGCLQEKPASGAIENPEVAIPEDTPVPGTPIERISNELDMLNSEGWGTLEAQLGRPRSTTLLWYHLKKITGFEPKVVFGNPDKLKTALAIPVKTGGDSTYPVIKIKNVNYYVIDPVTPAIISEFDYGYMYDDPGSVSPGFFNNFRLNLDDNAIVEQWMKETGVSLYYTDFPVNSP